MYNVDYFIKKFEAIPEEKWCVRDLHSGDGKSCAAGHCGTTAGQDLTEEAACLANLFAPLVGCSIPYMQIYTINDGITDHMGNPCPYHQATPKERILAALNDIKQQQVNEKELNRIVTVERSVATGAK